MSAENVELVRRAVAAFSQDVAAGRVGHQMEAFLDPEVEWCAREEPRTVNGQAAVLASLQEWFESMELVEFRPERFVDCGDTVVVLFSIAARGRGSGAEVRETLATAWTARGGRIVRYAEFGTAAEALRAAGLQE